MIYFIIPAYNEEKNLELLAKNIDEAMASIGGQYTVYIINDGSTDRTSELCAKLANDVPIKEIGFHANQGVGKAFKRGFEEAFKVVRKGDIIVTKEADNTSDPNILKKMVGFINDGYDVVLASCFAKEGGVENSSLDRHVLSFGANTLLKISFPIKGVNTYSSFYRAFNATVLKNVFEAYRDAVLEEKGFVCMVEMIVKMSRLPLKIVEVPMVLRCDKRAGESKMKRRKTIAGYLRFIGKQLLRKRSEDKAVLERFRTLAAHD